MSTPTRARALTHGSPSSTRVAVAPPDDDRAQLEATGLYGFLAECHKMLAERTDQVSMRGSWGNKGESAFFQPNWHHFSDQERSAVVEESPWWCWGAKRFEDDLLGPGKTPQVLAHH